MRTLTFASTSMNDPHREGQLTYYRLCQPKHPVRFDAPGAVLTQEASDFFSVEGFRIRRKINVCLDHISWVISNPNLTKFLEGVNADARRIFRLGNHGTVHGREPGQS